MIGRKHQQYGIIAVTRGFQCGHGNGRRGVATHRFEQDRLGLHTQLLQLFGGDETMFLVGHHQRRTAGDGRNALPGGLQHGLLARQGKELLGVGFARQWPQPGAGTTGQDDGKKIVHRGRPQDAVSSWEISSVRCCSRAASPRVSTFRRSSGSVLELRRLKRQAPKSALMPSVWSSAGDCAA